MTEDRAIVDGIPVTATARTLLDLAEAGKRRRLPGLLKRAEELGSLDYYEAFACCERSRGHRGAKPLAAALGIYRPAPRLTRSGLERRFLSLVESAGLPLPATNYIVGAYELDAYWPAAGLAVEIDTFPTHGTHASFEADRARDADLATIGVTVLRLTEARLDSEPERVVRQLAGMLAARRDAAPLRRASLPSPV